MLLRDVEAFRRQAKRRSCAPPSSGGAAQVPVSARGEANRLHHAADALAVKKTAPHCHSARFTLNTKMFATLLDIDLQTDYATPYETNRAAYLADAEALKKATGPYKAARDAYVAATATFTKSLYE
jgi:6-phosphogluconolactonase (cycloisomerase 2 family)